MKIYCIRKSSYGVSFWIVYALVLIPHRLRIVWWMSNRVGLKWTRVDNPRHLYAVASVLHLHLQSELLSFATTPIARKHSFSDTPFLSTYSRYMQTGLVQLSWVSRCQRTNSWPPQCRMNLDSCLTVVYCWEYSQYHRILRYSTCQP